MGTNFFVELNKCGCCNRADKIHIGKKSGGWAFSFRGYKNHYGHIETDDNKEVIVDESFKLTSWQEWKEYLKDKCIVDEYGRNISFKEFVELVEVYGSPGHYWKDGHKNLVHNEEMLNNPKYQHIHDRYLDTNKHWNDDLGYSFSVEYFA